PACLPACMHVCMSACMSVCQSACMSVSVCHLSVCLSVIYLSIVYLYPKSQNAITIAVSSRDYLKYQIQHEIEPFTLGPAFPFIKVKPAVNARLRELYPDSEELFDDQQSCSCGTSLFIERFCMTGGNSPGYLKPYHTNLYLSRIYKFHGLDKFFEHEKAHENNLLIMYGPLKGFLEALGKLCQRSALGLSYPHLLVTARSAASSGTRALKTLRSWGLEKDEALFLAGAPKGPMLEKIRPHIFFDDQMFHVEGAAELGTVAAHVPYGIAQKFQSKTVRDVKKRHVSQAARVNTALSIWGVTSDPFKSGF
uniref:5'-nucleotidase, cytosolic IAb n=1 Tax=Sinocyclocheilus anshuiensis TaxID=1608454 RepID=A0A671NQ83_9TELE